MMAVAPVVVRRLAHPRGRDPIRGQQVVATVASAVGGLSLALAAAHDAASAMVLVTGGVLVLFAARPLLARLLAQLDLLRREEAAVFAGVGRPGDDTTFYWAQRAVAGAGALASTVALLALAALVVHPHTYVIFALGGLLGAAIGLGGCELLSFVMVQRGRRPAQHAKRGAHGQ